MKTIFKFAAAICFIALIVLTSCKKEEIIVYHIDDYVSIKGGTSTSIDIKNKSTAFVDFIVSTTEAKGVDISAIKVYKQYISTDGTSSATVLHTTLNTFPATTIVTLPNALNGLGVNIDDFKSGDKLVFTLKVTADEKEYDSCHKFETTTFCSSELAGSYQVVTTYSQHDFLPNFASFTDTVEITQVEPGKYSLADLSGGLFSQGPYLGAYGTTGIVATFSEDCYVISWSGVADPWGAVVPAPGGINAVSNGGIITISWKCQAYNEQGVSVYTPL